MSTDNLARAFASTRNVLADVDRSQLDDATPCKSWTVRQLINHTLNAPLWGIGVIEHDKTTIDGEQDFASGDFVASYDVVAKDAARAFSLEGAMSKMVKLPFGEFPGSFLMTMVTVDQFTHGWDIARATGQPTDLDPQLAGELLSNLNIPDQFRGEDGDAPFGPERQAPPGATTADKIAAYLGREV